MASILNDTELKKLLGTVIVNGTEGSIRSNSYVIRLGRSGEFINSGKSFELSENKGIKLPSGHSVGVTSVEILDFSKETVNKIFPNQALHGLLTPTTDLSREGVVVAATQVDAGFKGTLCWTLTNTGSQERSYVYGERLFKLTIFKLDESEIPVNFYNGTYQNQIDYLRSCRKGAPVGMRDNDWFDPHVENGPEQLLDDLMNAGYPWQAVGNRLKQIDAQYKTISSEYTELNASIADIKDELIDVKNQQSTIGTKISEAVKDGVKDLSNSILVSIIKAIVIIAGLACTIISSQNAINFISKFGVFIGLGVIIIVFLFSLFQKSSKKK